MGYLIKVTVMLRKKITSFLADKSGSLLPLTAVMLPLLLGATGVGVDVSMWLKNRRDMQSAADAAAIAGAWEIAYDFSESFAEDAALKEALKNGYTDTVGNDLAVAFGTTDDGNPKVTVTLTRKDTKYFSQVVYKGDVSATVSAAAAVLTPNSDFCLLSLDPTADGALTAVGAVDLDSSLCGIAVNSNSDTAVDLSGNVDINIDLSDLSIVGGLEISGSVDLTTGNTITNAPKATDPYEDLEPPEEVDDTDCDHNNFSIGGTGTISPGVYCGGIRITGNGTITFNPGLYYLYAGDLDISGNGNIIANNVSIILTGSEEDGYGNLDVSGGKDMLFTAPADGSPMEGVAFFQDRNAPDDGSCNSLLGNSALDVFGATYFPSRCLEIGGNAGDSASSANPCSRIIAKRIRLHGTPNIGNACGGLPVDDIGYLSVVLVE